MSEMEHVNGSNHMIPGQLLSAPDEHNPYGISLTRRLVVPAAEKLLYVPKKTWGNGHITLVDYQGGDREIERVATAGHMSSLFPERPELPDFLDHLVSWGIFIPFKAVQFKFHIQCSIADALHIVYAKAASVNEYSGRYSVMIDSSFLPTAAYLEARMRGADPAAAAANARLAAASIAREREVSYQEYLRLVSPEIDLARELARAPLELNNDTSLFWKIDLDDLLLFCAQKKNMLSRHGGENSLDPYLTFMRDAAGAVALLATESLQLSRLGTGEKKHLTYPDDDAIIDPLPLPAPWGLEATRRVTVPDLEKLLYVPQPYLEHGAVQAVSYMGDNRGPVESARISYGAGTTRLSEDRNLLRYLIRHRHTTPFEHVEFALEGKTPLLVDPRQAGRHRTLDWHCFMGESLVGSEYFVPSSAELKYQDRKNRQGRGKELDDEVKEQVLSSMRGSYRRKEELASTLRNLGVDEESIRRTKGVGFYTFTWRTGDLHNWLHFLGLRLDAHAQKEIREYAGIAARFLHALSPDAMQALYDYRLNALSFSGPELKMLAAVLEPQLLCRSVQLPDFYKFHGMVRKGKDGEEVLTREGEEFQKKLKKLEELLP